MPVPYTIRTKRKRCVYEKRNDPAGSSFLWHQPGAGAGSDPVSAKSQSGAEGAGRGCAEPPEKSGNPDDGRRYVSGGVYRSFPPFPEEGAEVVPVLFLTLGFGLIGFLDDYLKVVLHRSDGLYPKQKMALQAVITAVFLWYLARFSGISLRMRIPFLPGKELDAGIFTIPFLAFVILGTVNGVNFTDGLDGLAASVTILNTVFFSVASIGLGNGVSPSPLAVIGSLLGFLVFNVFPARVFMGDTGSLALGGFVSGMACFLRLPLFLPLVGFIYMMEILSVILQVSFFKLTKGKRIFKMTPIHHHFELMGWSETQIVTVFATITAILCLIALMGL